MSKNPIDIATIFFGHWTANRIETPFRCCRMMFSTTTFRCPTS